MQLESLVFEVTRKCNANCEHCLRGEPQCKNISKKVIDKFFENLEVDYISTLTFTGGEPTLAIPQIKYIVDKIKENRIDIGAFDVTTNGIIKSISLVNILQDLYSNYVDDREACHFCISKDQYHNYAGIDYYNAEDYYSNYLFYKPDSRKRNIEYLVDQGRAVNISERKKTIRSFPYEIQDDYVIGMVYININGDVCNDCDLSYESQDYYKIGNIFEDKLIDLINQNVSKVEL